MAEESNGGTRHRCRRRGAQEGAGLINGAVLLRAALTTVVAFAAGLQASFAEAPEPRMSFKRAEELIRSGKGQEAMPTLEYLAKKKGDARAQFYLGLSYIEGKWVAQDKVQGLAWLTIITTAYNGSSFRVGTQRQASELILQTAGSLSGTELIKADQIANAYAAARSAGWAKSFERNRRAVRGQTVDPPDSFDTDFPFKAGCAYNQNQNGCKRSDSDKAVQSHCTDEMPVPDTLATVRGPGWRPLVDDPTQTLPKLHGLVVMIVQVDKSGWVCFAKVTDGSGDPTTDRAAVDSVTRWRITPAKKDDSPVESILLVWLRFP